MQYTIRGILSAVGEELRERIRRNRQSLNDVVFETLRQGLELEVTETTFDDLDDTTSR